MANSGKCILRAADVVACIMNQLKQTKWSREIERLKQEIRATKQQVNEE